MAGRLVAGAVMALSMVAAPGYAQSLGELARQEEARRAGGSKSVKTLSNASLKPGEVSSPASAASPDSPANCYVSKRLGRCVSAEEMVANSAAGAVTRENAPLEPRWRQDAGSIRSQIDRTHGSIATLEAVAADPGRSAGDRRAAEQTLAAARQALAGYERQWEKLEITAAAARIPRAWIEPIPVLSPRLQQK